MTGTNSLTMFLIDISFKIIAIVLAMTIHEFVKASISAKYGDPTPQKKGRLTLNPIKHIEPIGFILMIALGYGWSNPTETRSNYYKDYRRHTILTYVTPSIVNILIMVIFCMIYRTVNTIPTSFKGIELILILFLYIAKYNFALALFNIIPVSPLDGAKVLSLSLSPNSLMKVNMYEKVFQIILILLLIMGFVGVIFDPIIGTTIKLLTGVRVL